MKEREREGWRRKLYVFVYKSLEFWKRAQENENKRNWCVKTKTGKNPQQTNLKRKRQWMQKGKKNIEAATGMPVTTAVEQQLRVPMWHTHTIVCL